MAKRTVVLIILDGWGIGAKDESNPIHTVAPSQFKWIEENYPTTSLQASGISVGLPWGEVGNSEVGHLTIGAGKVIYQYYPRILMAIQDGSFFENETLKAACTHAKKNNSALNLVGLLSKGNVHASIEHLEALVELAKREKVPRLKLHLFADGKDSAPQSFLELLTRVPAKNLSTVIGRYYAMDREENWSLTQETYQTITGGNGTIITADTLSDTVKKTYAKNLTDEFIPALRFGGNEQNINDGDAVLFFNYREDSMRQLVEAFVDPSFDKFPTQKFTNTFIATMTDYKESFNVPVALQPDTVTNPLGKILADNEKIQLRLAETYKYAHITYFFNGYREPPFKNEYRVLIPSETIPHPEEHPQMMAPAITDRLTQALQEQVYDFILVNYANPDSIAHSGNYDGSLEAVRIINAEIERILKAVIGTPTALIITSDHGNIEEVFNPSTGEKETHHDPNPVPFYLVGDEFMGKTFPNRGNLRNETIGVLSDVAPTILALLNIPQPKEMTGENLIKKLM